MDKNKIAYLDCETQFLANEIEGGFSNPQGMGLTVLCIRYAQVTHIYTPEEKAIKSIGIAPSFLLTTKEACQTILDDAECIVSFNGIRFDYKVLEGVGFDTEDWEEKSYDILVQFHTAKGFRVSLDKLAGANLKDQTKSMDGIKAVKTWRDAVGLYSKMDYAVAQDKFVQVIHYCIQDVKVTGLLYWKIQEDGKLLYPDKRSNMLKTAVID
tara:strand:- start:714 stop:1346 length:633 start_codon:yes stop_codon:yes gene_type:complete